MRLSVGAYKDSWLLLVVEWIVGEVVVFEIAGLPAGRACLHVGHNCVADGVLNGLENANLVPSVDGRIRSEDRSFDVVRRPNLLGASWDEGVVVTTTDRSSSNLLCELDLLCATELPEPFVAVVEQDTVVGGLIEPFQVVNACDD